jgi:lipopolysaccharide transport system ATP-binding protein
MQSFEGDSILRVSGVTKRFPLYRSSGHRLARSLFGRAVKAPMEYTALEDVSFDLKKGDALAVIGRNGAGKSTLLQILSGVLEPTSGTVICPARIAGLLELGSGFNPEFSGLENVYVNSAILGLSKAETEVRLQAIIEFADIGDYISQAVKTYSSGMFLRLAFSVAIHAEPELLLVDEALTVGDVFFQQKCYSKLAQLRLKGTTVLLVTHSMGDAAEFCNRGIVLSEGRIVYQGSGKESVEYYFHHERDTLTGRKAKSQVRSSVAENDASTGALELPVISRESVFDHIETIDLAKFTQFGNSNVKALRVLITDTKDAPRRVFQQGDWLKVHVDFLVEEVISVPLVGIQLINSKGNLVHSRNSMQFEALPPTVLLPGAILRCQHEIKLDVDVGEYTLETGIAEISRELFDRRHRYTPIEIAPEIHLLCHVSNIAAVSVVYRREAYPCLFSHYGIADLPSRQALHLFAPTPIKT